ncbi:hypothetical protein [Paraglaciecola chathamensis]|uniref:hypothetical protein n=1 Tax=Paraglaciecola chathamensis TaxID=368405 RepID=UPI00363C15FC
MNFENFKILVDAAYEKAYKENTNPKFYIKTPEGVYEARNVGINNDGDLVIDFSKKNNPR